VLWGAMGLGVAVYAFLPGSSDRGAAPHAVATTSSAAAPSAAALAVDADGPAARPDDVAAETTLGGATPPGALQPGVDPEVVQRTLPAHRRRRGSLRGAARKPRGVEAVDRALEAQDPGEAIALIERELGTRPATDEQARVLLVGRLAKVKNDQRALNRLIAEATSGLTRGERLAALAALADPIAPCARPVIEGLAKDGERDAEVRRRAREILGRN
jgi:hypothetical protein